MRPIRALFVAAALVAAGASSAATAGWSVPATLGQSNLNFMYANNVSVAVSQAPQAQGVAVWVEPTTMAIKYAVRRSGAWSGTKTLYTANANAAEQVTDPQVVIDSSGMATAVWASTKQGAVTYCASGGRVVRCIPLISYAKVATLPAGATTWTKANLSAQGWTVTDAQVGLDQSGNAVAMWSYRATSGATPTLQAASRTAAGAWTSPIGIYTSAAVSLPRLAVGGNGAAMIAWTEGTVGTPAGYALRASYRATGAAWGAPETVTTQSSPIGAPRCALTGSGEAAVVWSQDYGVRWARRSVTWSAPTDLVSAPGRLYAGTGPFAAYGPDIAANVAGDFLITWLESDVLANGNSAEAELVPAAAQASHASWLAGTTVPPSVALSPDGSLGTVAWLDENDYNTYAVNLDPAVGWGAPLLLSSGAARYNAVWGTGVSLAAGPNQQAATVWLGVAGINGKVNILASSYAP